MHQSAAYGSNYEYYDGGIGGVFVVFMMQGCNIDNWHRILAFYAFYIRFVHCINESVEFIFRDCVDYYAILWFAYCEAFECGFPVDLS